ncbi:MAG TPA: efflux RND transporter periplasmic adaptor subunit [Ignavibacteria bacterium]|nr:efflux RND transporter periplasmic adaptor subunit [Ignavibacteria bacterium]HMR39622.1 efflux RND transporter periplasmic adaptor subunit [Ignavibacteria bacterium]
MKKQKKKSKKKLWIIGISLLVIIIAAIVISGMKDDVVIVQTEKIGKRNLTQVVTATGKVQSETQVNISAEISGEIISLPFKEGETVKKNDLIVKIKQDAYAPELQQQNAAIDVAESNLAVNEVALKRAQQEMERLNTLYKKGLATQSEIDNAQNNIDQALATLNSIQAQVNQQKTGLSRIRYDISKTTIYSPMDGTVTQLNNELGEKVLGTISNQGSQIMTISDLAKMECQVEVGETDVSTINIGDTARIEIDAFPDKVFTGYVYEIANSALQTGQGTQDAVVNFVVKIRILNNDVDLRPGMSCTVDIEVEHRKDVLAVPIQCVTTREEEFNMAGAMDNSSGNVKRESQEKLNKKMKPREVIFIIDNDEARVEEVKTGISDDSYIELVEGASLDQEVVKGSFKAINKILEDSTKIKVDNEIKKRKKKKYSEDDDE